LWGEIPEQLGAVVDRAVAISIQSQPGVIRTGSGPGKFFFGAVAVQIEPDTAVSIGKIEPVTLNIDGTPVLKTRSKTVLSTAIGPPE
jgi:hypothetical protein